MARLHLHWGRVRFRTDGLALWATGGKGTTGRQVGKIRGLATNLHQGLALQLDAWQAAQERLGVGMAGGIEDVQGTPSLDDFPGV